MKSVVENTITLFKKNKEFIYLVTIQPVLIFFLMSFLLPYTTMHSVAVANCGTSEMAFKISENLETLEGIKLTFVQEDKIEEKLIGGNAELAVVISDAKDGEVPQVKMLSLGDSEVESVIELCVNDTIGSTVNNEKVTVNEAKSGGISVSNSLAFMIFKTLTAGSILGALFITERRKRMKDRILLSGTGKVAYYLGRSIVCLLFMMLGSLFYYLVGVLLRFDFGMRNSIGFLLMLFVSNVLSVALYVFFSAFLNKEDALGFVGTFILMPMSLFSGVLFPYRFMPAWMQKVGACFPQRWIALAIEKMQISGQIMSGWREIVMVLGLSIILFIIGINCDGSKKTERSK